MSKQITDKAIEYLGYQLSVIPTKANKIPAVPAWTPYQKERIKAEDVNKIFSGSNVKGLAIICGSISGSLEVIDVDCKYDLTGSLWRDLKTIIEDKLPDVFSRLVIAETKSGGYHIYYSCSQIGGNEKLASRPTTEAEREQTYRDNINDNEPEDKAKKAAERDKVRVLIETRGEGGYVIAPPSDGYKYIQGDPGNITTITPEEREQLLSISKSFDEIPAEPEKAKADPVKKGKPEGFTGLTSLEDYNLRGDLVELLEGNGWKVVSRSGERVFLKRPGASSTSYSGNFHTGLRTLRVFSKSTEFNPEKAYNPVEVYTLLECNGDYSKAAKELGKKGYGDPYKRPEQTSPGSSQKSAEQKTDWITVELVNRVTGESRVICKPGETLNRADILNSTGEEAIITSPGEAALDGVLRAVDLIRTNINRIYIKQGGYEIREYSYILNAIFKKYGTIQAESGGLTYRQIDNLLDEIVEESARLEPIDKDLLLKEFLQLETTKELGISEEAITVTVDRLTTTREKEKQGEYFKRLISEADKLHQEGKTDKALDLLDDKVKGVKLQSKATEFNKLLLPTSEDQIKREEESQPDSLDTGYKIAEDTLLLPGGAISVFAAPTNHGKTVMLINTALNVADRYPDKRFFFFTYEERATAIIQYFLNAYMDIELNKNESEKSNRRLIKEYFKTGSTQFISRDNRDLFQIKKEEFFKTYIETGRITVKYVDYNSQELTMAIDYLQKQTGNLAGVFIDYFQLLKLPQDKYRNYNSRQEELKQICISLKDTAVKTGLPLILAAQFNREVTNLCRLHPTHIGEAGDIERIVNTLVGLWNMDKKPVLKGITDAEVDEINLRVAARRLEGDRAKNMYLEILKSRDLPTGSYEFLDFNGRTGKIKNRDALKQDYFTPNGKSKSELKYCPSCSEGELLAKFYSPTELICEECGGDLETR
jgi:replicative DNA helicase